MGSTLNYTVDAGEILTLVYRHGYDISTSVEQSASSVGRSTIHHPPSSPTPPLTILILLICARPTMGSNRLVVCRAKLTYKSTPVSITIVTNHSINQQAVRIVKYRLLVPRSSRGTHTTSVKSNRCLEDADSPKK